MSQTLGLFVGTAFAEATLFDQSQKTHQAHCFLPRQNIKSFLQKFLNEKSSLKKVYITSRFLKKILNYRLGGGVAQLVTSGFENWLEISHNPTSRDLSGFQAAPSISSQELIFSINERVSANGQVLQPLSIETLEPIASKLKIMEIKRVCVHFLNARTNPVHQNQATQFLKEQGFEVYVPKDLSFQGELAAWRENTLNAGISGTQEDLIKDILEVLGPYVTAEKIFLKNENEFIPLSQTHRAIESLFGFENTLAQNCKNKSLLFMGLEKFIFFPSHGTQQFWKSSWGYTSLSHPNFKELSLQPTRMLEINYWNELGFGKELGYEPGPMHFGRGQVPLLLDLILTRDEPLKNSYLKDQMHAQGASRFHSTLLTLSKLCDLYRSLQVEKVQENLMHFVSQSIAKEVQLMCPEENLVLGGTLASSFYPRLQTLLPHFKIQWDQNLCESQCH